MADTMQVRLKKNPSANPVTIQKTDYDANLHTAVNPEDLKTFTPKTASVVGAGTGVSSAKPVPDPNARGPRPPDATMHSGGWMADVKWVEAPDRVERYDDGTGKIETRRLVPWSKDPAEKPAPAMEGATFVHDARPEGATFTPKIAEVRKTA